MALKVIILSRAAGNMLPSGQQNSGSSQLAFKPLANSPKQSYQQQYLKWAYVTEYMHVISISFIINIVQSGNKHCKWSKNNQLLDDRWLSLKQIEAETDTKVSLKFASIGPKNNKNYLNSFSTGNNMISSTIHC